MLVRGPFRLKWGDNVLADIEELDIEYEVDSDDIQTVQGKTYEVDGAHKATVTITLLGTDIASLAAILPQYYIANGATLSTGETVNNAAGAIDVVPHSCDESLIENDLDIIGCGSNPQVTRFVNCRTKLDGIEIDDKVQKFMIKFVSEAEEDEATVQVFRQGTANVVS